MHAPVLLEDGSSLDWPNATYSPVVGIGTRMARIEHRVDGAPVISEMVSRGDAVWAVELRCPKTLIARISTSVVADHTVRWDDGDIDDSAWLIPGVLATTDIDVPDATVLHEVWHDASPRFPAGYWLARGDARRVRSFRDSLLYFRLDPDLPPGRMRVETDRSSGNLRFAIRAAADVHREAMEGQGNRSVWVAALVGVCGHFGRVFGGMDEAEEESDDSASDPLAEEIRVRLSEANVPSWDDGDLYDPAAAATAIEPFVFPPSATDGESRA